MKVAKIALLIFTLILLAAYFLYVSVFLDANISASELFNSFTIFAISELLVITLIIVFLKNLKPRLAEKRVFWKNFIIIGVILLFNATVLFSGMSKLLQGSQKLKFDLQIRSAYRQVCSGTPASEAAHYDPSDTGIHPMIWFSMSGWPLSVESIDSSKVNWTPESIGEVQLVVCTGAGVEEKSGSCSYNTGYVTKYHSTWAVTIRDPRTGNVIANKDFVDEGGCPQILNDSNYSSLHGNTIPNDDILDWLTQYIDTH